MNPLLRMFHRGGAALVLSGLSPVLLAHMELTPRLTPTPASFDTSGSMISSGDRAFLTRAAESVRTKMTVSQAVMDELSNPQLKSFAQQVIAETALYGSDLLALAEQKGVELPTKEESRLTEDGSKKSQDADHQYVGQMVWEYEYSVNLFEDAAASGDAEVAAFARKTLPALQRQLAAVRDLQKAID